MMYIQRQDTFKQKFGTLDDQQKSDDQKRNDQKESTEDW